MQRSIGVIIVLTVFLHEHVSFAAEDSREKPPNIVFVFSDDHACSTISAGQIILTGSIPSLILIAEDCGIRVDAPPFGSVEVKFIT